MLTLILLIFAFVLAVLESLRPWQRPLAVPHLGWLAIALYLLTLILSGRGL